MTDKEKIERLEKELDKVYEELYDLKSKKDNSYLQDSHFELIRDIEIAIITKLDDYKKVLYSDEEPSTEDFIKVLNNINRYIKEYKKSYNL